jgi:transcriptional regulator with XRE-family HTH domain
MPDIALNQEGLKALRRKQGIYSDQDLAKRLGVDIATVSRVMAGKAAPGRKFIACALRYFGVAQFTELFTVTD